MPWGANLGSTDGFVSTLYYNLRQVEHDSYAATGGYLAGNRLQVGYMTMLTFMKYSVDLIVVELAPLVVHVTHFPNVVLDGSRRHGKTTVAVSNPVLQI